MVLNMLYNSNGLALIDDVACFDDKLFRVSLELIKCGWTNLLQDCYYRFSRKPSILNQFTYQIISYLHANFLVHRLHFRISNSHGSSLLQLLFTANSIHCSRYQTYMNIRNIQMVIQLNNSLLNQFVRLEVNCVVCLMINLAP